MIEYLGKMLEMLVESVSPQLLIENKENEVNSCCFYSVLSTSVQFPAKRLYIRSFPTYSIIFYCVGAIKPFFMFAHRQHIQWTYYKKNS